MHAVTEAWFPAMGSDVHVVVVDGDRGSAATARRLVEDLERRWSRFLPDSEIARCNRADGRAVVVSSETRQLVQAALTGWHASNGAFDPAIAHAMDANGYGARSPQPGVTRVVPGMFGSTEIDDAAGTVRLPAGIAFDPGGIGKGLAADLVVATLAARGAAGVLAEIGGDVRVWGTPPAGDAWVLSVEDPFAPDRDAGTLLLRDGAAATSSSLGRRWTSGGKDMHHIVDPATGIPTAGAVVAVTAVAGAAWWAEVVTKSLFLAGGDARGLLGDGAAVVWMRDGTRRHVGAADAFFSPSVDEGLEA